MIKARIVAFFFESRYCVKVRDNITIWSLAVTMV